MSEAQQAANTPTNPPNDAETIARLQAYSQAAALDPENFKPDQMFSATLSNALTMIQRRPSHAPWRRTFSGSGDNKGWSIYAGNDLIAYIGGEIELGQALDAIIYAHNKVLGYVL